MKTKITIKSIRNDSRAKIAVRYCELQDILDVIERTGYHASRLYGWNFDVYAMPSAIISTGYRRMPGVLASHEACKHASAAFAAWRDAHPAAAWDELQRAACDVLDSFCREVLPPETHTLTAAD